MATSKIDSLKLKDESFLKKMYGQLSTEKASIENEISIWYMLNQKEIEAIRSLLHIPGTPAASIPIGNKDDVQKYITDLQDRVESLKKLSHFEDIKKLKNLFDKVQEHLNTDYNPKILGQIISDSSVLSMCKPVNTGFDLLLELLNLDSNRYDPDLSTSFEKSHLQTALAERLESLKYTIEAVTTVSDRLEKLEEHKKTLENNYDAITKLHSKSDEITREMEFINSMISMLHSQSERLVQNKQKQRGILAQELKIMLTNYMKERGQHYYLNDKSRADFIQGICGEGSQVGGMLASYVSSGDSTPLLKKITTEIDRFPGVKMQATLNKVLVKILDAESNYSDPSPIDISNKLTTLSESNHIKVQKYASKVSLLLKKINGMSDYAETLPSDAKEKIKTLIDQLKKDVNHLVMQTPNDGTPTEEVYKRFEMNFKARLHSQDDVMSKHQSWASIVANILLNIIAIAKMILSKVICGRASLFFDSIEQQKNIEAHVDVALEEVSDSLKGTSLQ